MSDFEGIVPGSLPARVLDHMRIAKGEFEAGEIAEAMQVDLSEARAAMGTLRKACKVITRIEEGSPLYRLPDATPGTRIAGSALKVISDPTKRETRRTDPPAGKAPAAQPAPEPAKDRTEKPMDETQTREPSQRSRILAYLAEHPAITAADLTAALGINAHRMVTQLNYLETTHRVRKANATKPYQWAVAGDAAASIEPPKLGRPPRVQTPARPHAVKNLAQIGPATPATRSAIKYAIDANGTVAIEELRLPPDEVARLVRFLELTQHVWQAAA